jgi:hypothetical protein
MNDQTPIRTGTLCGTFFSILASIPWTEMGKTLVLTTIGALTSFLVSYGMKKLLDKLGRKRSQY